MEFIIISVIIVILIIILKFIFEYNISEMKKIGINKELDEIAKKYPSNIEICKEYLKMVNNEDVIVEENKDTEASLYIAITNKISIANIQKSYTRIQTLAHECLHSIQDRKLLLFNFYFSNVYLLYFVISLILSIFFNKLQLMLFIILQLFGITMYMVRAYLENDAMIKARFLAKEYLEEKKISDSKEINKMVYEFDKINNLGIKCTNYDLFLRVMIKSLIFCIVCIIRNII